MIQLVRESTRLLHLALGAAFGNIATESKEPLNRRPCGLVQDWLMRRKPSDLTWGETMPTH